MRLVRACGPDLPPVHLPLIAAELGPRYRTGDVGSAARFAEQLAPDILTSQNAEKELLLLPVGAMLKDRRSSKGADSHLGDADGADALEFLLDDRYQADGKVAAVPARRPMRHAPPGLSQFETPFHQPIVRVPVRFQPGADFGADGIFVDLDHFVRPQAGQFCSISFR